MKYEQTEMAKLHYCYGSNSELVWLAESLKCVDALDIPKRLMSLRSRRQTGVCEEHKYKPFLETPFVGLIEY